HALRMAGRGIDEAVDARVLPDRKPRTARAPRIEHLGVGSRPGGDPFEQLTAQVRCGVDRAGMLFAHRATASGLTTLIGRPAAYATTWSKMSENWISNSS